MLKNFEMSRSPLADFPHSNGHGRRQLGATPVSRQGNLIVESSKTVTNAELRAKLIELIKAQNKPFGLLIDDIAGGFTFTGRGQPQAFQVLPLVVYKVFADGRPDELVRGVDIVGTPLAALTKIVATGDTTGSFQRLLRSRIRFRAGFRRVSRDSDLRAGSAEKGKLHRPSANFARAGARHRGCQDRRPAMKTTLLRYSLFLLACGDDVRRRRPMPRGRAGHQRPERQRPDPARHAR